MSCWIDNDSDLNEEPMLYPDIPPHPCIYSGWCEDEDEDWCPGSCIKYTWKEPEA